MAAGLWALKDYCALKRYIFMQYAMLISLSYALYDKSRNALNTSLRTCGHVKMGAIVMLILYGFLLGREVTNGYPRARPDKYSAPRVAIRRSSLGLDLDITGVAFARSRERSPTAGEKI